MSDQDLKTVFTLLWHTWPWDNTSFEEAYASFKRNINFYGMLGAYIVKNTWINSQNIENPTTDPWPDEQKMIYPTRYDWPNGQIDLNGSPY